MPAVLTVRRWSLSGATISVHPKDAGTVGAKFAADKSIVAVIGHLCSSATLAAMPIYVRAGLAAISPTSTNATIGDVGKGWFFRNCYTDDLSGPIS